MSKDANELFVAKRKEKRGSDSTILDRPKLRGAMMKFAEDVDSVKGVKGNDKEFNMWIAFDKWMRGRVNKWAYFCSRWTDSGAVKDTFYSFYKSNDEFKELLDEKYVEVEKKKPKKIGRSELDRWVEKEGTTSSLVEEKDSKRREFDDARDTDSLTTVYCSECGDITPDNKDPIIFAREHSDNGHDVQIVKADSDVVDERPSIDVDSVNIEDTTIDDWEDEDVGDRKEGNDYPGLKREGVIHGDSSEVIDNLKEEYGVFVDAIITDPPYGIEFSGRGEHDAIEGDADVSEAMNISEKVLKKAKLITKKGAPVLIFCGDSNLAETVMFAKEWFDYKQTLPWDKRDIGMGHSDAQWRPCHEFAVLCGNRGIDVVNSNRHDGSVLHFQRVPGNNMDHPTQKPASMMKYLVESLTDPNDLVFDPFAGSGSTLVGANQAGRRYLGIELDKDYYELCKSRLKQKSIMGIGD